MASGSRRGALEPLNETTTTAATSGPDRLDRVGAYHAQQTELARVLGGVALATALGRIAKRMNAPAQTPFMPESTHLHTGIPMSIFGSILAKIFPSSHPSVTTAGTTAAAPQETTPAASAAPAVAPVDVEKILTDKATSAGQPLNWRSSIVDLMKLLSLDSSLAARKALASELHYSGDTNDSAAMNLWLHKQVMAKLAANGGKVPAELM
jgi:hypothetical protein